MNREGLTRVTAEPSKPLRCPACGNEDHFVEFMAAEVHLVNGNRDYVRLLVAEVDYYRCHKCGIAIHPETLEPPSEV